jgi:hypothetical protein
MTVRHAELASRIALEVELDHDRRLVTDDPSVVPGLDRDHLGRRVFSDAPIRVPDVDTSPREEAHARACMQRSVPTIGFMSTDHRNPGG